MEDGGGREGGTLLVQVSSESHVHKAMLCTYELSVCVGEVYGLGFRVLGTRGLSEAKYDIKIHPSCQVHDIAFDPSCIHNTCT